MPSSSSSSPLCAPPPAKTQSRARQTLSRGKERVWRTWPANSCRSVCRAESVIITVCVVLTDTLTPVRWFLFQGWRLYAVAASYFTLEAASSSREPVHIHKRSLIKCGESWKFLTIQIFQTSGLLYICYNDCSI